MRLPQKSVPEPQLERQARRLARPGAWFLLVGIALIVPGIVVFLIASGWLSALGIAVAVLGFPLVWIGLGATLSGGVAHWSAHHRPFA